ALLAPAAALAVEGAGAHWSLRPLAAVLLACCAAADWCWGLPLSRLPVFTGRVPAETFLSRSDPAYYPAPLYPAARWLGEHAPAGARVLILGDARGFQVPRDYILSTPMQTSVLERWANAAADGAALRERFRAAGVDYIVVNHAEIVRRQLEFDFTRGGMRTLDEFWGRWTEKVFQAGPDFLGRRGRQRILDRWVAVYRVLSDAEAAAPHPHDDLFAGYSVR
ncbi:MAG: hypothetical protein KGL53_11390, partial [Elusimicrobia bacterium]|nr:hypothetical protein [Elusimicrobiota bacterium]